MGSKAMIIDHFVGYLSLSELPLPSVLYRF